MSEAALDVAGVEKTYRGGVRALRGVSLEVPEASIFGLLGPNGAGKSTLVKILTTIIRPSRCRGRLLGHPIGHKATLRKVGYLPEHARFPAYLTGRQVIEYAAGLCGVKVSPAEVERLLELVGMSGGAEKRTIRTYSKGMIQRIGLAQAMVNVPRLVILDEPTDGVDPEGRYQMRQILQELRADGVTVFINSHLLGELETLCDSIAILKEGEVIRQGPLRELTAASCVFEVITGDAVPEETASRLREFGYFVGERRVTVEGADPAPLQRAIDTLRSGRVAILEVRKARQSLEDLFMESIMETQKTTGGGGLV